MLFRSPFSYADGGSVRMAIIVCLLFLHSAWIVFHLNLVSREIINPWKLGGYGMYTGVDPESRLHLFDTRIPEFEIPPNVYKYWNIYTDNWYFIFRCEPITVASLQTFLKENPRFVGVPLRFIVTENKLLRDPIREERLPHAILEIRWTGQRTLDYAGKICGKLFRGKFELEP